MRNFLIIFIVLGFSFSALPAEDSETEAGAGCTTPECLGIAGIVGSPDLEVAELCRETLPAHCQQIKEIKFTKCYDDQAGAGKAIAGGGYSCLIGLWEGGVDVVSAIVKSGQWALNFTMDEEYREESLNAMSFFFEQFSDSEKFKELLSGPILEEMDEFMECLNYRGRWEYVCEAGIQLTAIVYGYKKIKYGYTKVKQAIGGRRNIQKLSIRQKFKQREELQELLSGTSYVDISDLTGYQLSRLRPKDMRRMNISNFTDDTGSFLSNRQLRAIPPLKMKDLDINVNHRTLNRLSDEQFKAAMINGNITNLPFSVIEKNLKRIRSSDIPKLLQLDHVSPKVFGQMSVAQIRNMSYRQVNDVTPEQVSKLSRRKKEALEETRQKRNTEEVEAQKQREKDRRAEERRKRAEERRQRQQQQQEASTEAGAGASASETSSSSAKSGAKKPKNSESSEQQPKDQKQQSDSDNSTKSSGSESSSGAASGSSSGT